jgi:putative transcriptional regulator
MKIVRMNIDAAVPGNGRIDPDRVDDTSEEQIAAQQACDDAQARQEEAGSSGICVPDCI